MPDVANLETANAMRGRSVGTGQCVASAHAAVATPPSSEWRRGATVRGNLLLAPGTVIATLDPDGHYGNHLDGSSHAAIYLGQTGSGIQVLDQWTGHTVQPVHERTIRFHHGVGSHVNDGDQFSVVQ